MTSDETEYLPAAGRDWALPFYDPMVRLLGADRVRDELLGRAAIQPGLRVLDVGCGTGTLLVTIKRRHPNVEMVGLDPDPKALARARHKADQAGIAVQLDRGFADRLPYPDATFDRVLSSFMFHHLPAEARGGMLREVGRVLKRDGVLHLADFTQGGLIGWFHAHQHLADNTVRRLLALMTEAGLAAKKTGETSMLLGLFRIAFYEAAAA